MKIDDIGLLIKNLPEWPHFEGESEYSTSVVLLLLVPIEKELHILFEKRAAAIRQGGEISLPGGRKDGIDEALETTAIRETTEELGIPAYRIRTIGRLDSIIAPIGAIVHVFVGLSDITPMELKPNPSEVDKAFLLPVSRFQNFPPETYRVVTEVRPYYMDPATNEKVVLFPTGDVGLPERYWNGWGGAKHKIYVYRTEEGPIWGITARIVRDFIQKL